jgi:hypothetical protein
MNDEIVIRKRKSVFGTLSLIFFFAGIFAGILIAKEIMSGVEEMASLGAALAAGGIICFICIPSLVFSVIGFMRKEKPLWPAIVGFLLSVIPGGAGLLMLFALLEQGFSR